MGRIQAEHLNTHLLDGSSLFLHPNGAGKSPRLQNSQCTPILECAHLNGSFHLGLQCFHTDCALSSIQMQDLRRCVSPLATVWAYSSIQKAFIMFFVLHTIQAICNSTAERPWEQKSGWFWWHQPEESTGCSGVCSHSQQEFVQLVKYKRLDKCNNKLVFCWFLTQHLECFSCIWIWKIWKISHIPLREINLAIQMLF